MRTNKLSRLRLFLWALPMLMLAGCDKEEIGGQEPGSQTGTSEINFEIGFAPQTRASTGEAFNTTWENGDEIGLFAVRHASGGTGTLSATPANNYINNVKLTYTAGSGGNPGTWAVDAGSELYFPGGTDVLDFYAYYPYDAAASDPTAITFNVKTDQSASTAGKPNYNASDLMIAAAKNKARSTAPIPLIFSHALALVQVDMSSKEVNVPNYDPSKITVKLKGVKPAAMLNLGAAVGSEVTLAATATPGDITMTRVEQSGDANYATNYTYRALVPAQSLAASRLFSFAQDANGDGDLADYDDFMFTSPQAAVTLVPGGAKKYAVTLGWGIDPNHMYKVGDPYPHVGRKIGVVYWLDTDAPGYDGGTLSGPGGKIVSLQEANTQVGSQYGLVWSTENATTNATSLTDGAANMTTIKALASWETKYPAFKWCSDLGAGWYLPARDELFALYVAYNTNRVTFNGYLTTAGGTALESTTWPYYWSSTQYLDDAAWHVGFANGTTNGRYKYTQHRVRAVSAF